MIFRTIWLMLLMCLTQINSSTAQTAADFELVKTAFQPISKKKLATKYSDVKYNPNELQTVFSGLFLAYKSFISSQDSNHCNFHPSCSEFGLRAIKKYGIIRGGICTFDRLTRCNGLDNKWYKPDLEKKAFIDPVDW